MLKKEIYSISYLIEDRHLDMGNVIKYNTIIKNVYTQNQPE